MRKLLLIAVAAMMVTMTLISCNKDDDDTGVVPRPEEQVVLNCAKPDYLKAGDKVAMISPSYFTPMETIEKAADVLRSWGFEPVIGPNVGKVLDGKIGGTVEERVSDIRWALSEPTIKAILCNRGGYGTQGKDQILFVEEIGENMRNIDRQMRLLKMHGVFDRCKGVILGEFVSCGTEFTDQDGEVISIEAMLHDLLAEYHIPVLCAFPTGHDDVNLPLVMGAPVTIDVRSDGATLQFNIDGDQQPVNTATITATPTPVATRMWLAGKIE